MLTVQKKAKLGAWIGAGEMGGSAVKNACCTTAVLADQSSVLSTHVWQLITTCNSSYRKSDALLCPPVCENTYTYRQK